MKFDELGILFQRNMPPPFPGKKNEVIRENGSNIVYCTGCAQCTKFYLSTAAVCKYVHYYLHSSKQCIAKFDGLHDIKMHEYACKYTISYSFL
jgi:hypothetical protein